MAAQVSTLVSFVYSPMNSERSRCIFFCSSQDTLKLFHSCLKHTC
ncbi:unnamed protein product [Musa textilis]